MRRHGLSYRQILNSVPVAKSTLSLWLRDVGLAKRQKQELSERRAAGALRGARSRHLQKEKVMGEIISSAKSEITSLSIRERWLIGIALYWAEGSKEKEYKSGSSLIFNNSDPRMIKLYIKWLEQNLQLPRTRIHLTLYIHETKRNEIETIRHFWTSYLKFPSHAIQGIYFKKGSTKTVRNNTGSLYYGTLRVTVSTSSSLNRKVAGWIEGIVSAK